MFQSKPVKSFRVYDNRICDSNLINAVSFCKTLEIVRNKSILQRCPFSNQLKVEQLSSHVNTNHRL